MNLPEEARAYRYRPAAILRVAGQDASTFLQGQFTNDLSKLEPGLSVYGLWLDRKGRVIADSHILRLLEPESYRVVSLESSGPEIARHLEAHLIADEVTVDDLSGGWSGLSLIGAGVGRWLSGQSRPGSFFPGRRTRSENWEWVFPDSEAPGAEACVGSGSYLDASSIERLRIESAIACVPRDIGAADLPNEGGLDLEAISYSKGCYLGQEVMARVKALGRVRRTLLRVRGVGAPPALPAPLWLGAERAGELRSAAAEPGGYVGLALVSVASASDKGALSLGQGAPPSVEFVR